MHASWVKIKTLQINSGDFLFIYLTVSINQPLVIFLFILKNLYIYIYVFYSKKNYAFK